jgi:hypothetical protein
MNARNQVIRASRFVLSSLKPMERIAIDTIGPVPDDMGFKYIIVLIDTFTRYVELFPKQEVTALAAADALFKHMCRFTTPLEIVTDFGSQFVNQMLTHFTEMSGIKHHTSIPYSKEENGIVERANKEVNRHIRNILFDKGHFKNWSRLLCMTERILNSSVKQPLGASPNTLLFGHAFQVDPALLSTLDRDISDEKPRSIRDFVDTLMERQDKLIDAAIQSQVAINEDNLRKRYANYPRIPKIRNRIVQEVDDNTGTTDRIPITHIFVQQPKPKPPIIAAAKWLASVDPVTGEQEYIRVIQSVSEVVDTVDEIDMSPYVLTTYSINDFVLRRYPPSKIGGGNPHKYGSWWRGPYQVTGIVQQPVSETNSKPCYTIRSLIDDKEYMADVTHLRPFYFDPEYVTPLNIAAKDKNEEVIEKIIQHDFSDLSAKRWLVRWHGGEETWERFDNLRNVEAFQHYCATNDLDPFPPKLKPKFSASMPNLLRQAGGPFAVPTPPIAAASKDIVHGSTLLSARRRGRPRKISV